MGRKKKNGNRKLPFSLTPEQKQKYICSDSPLSASELCKRLSDLSDDSQVKKLTYNALTNWLLRREILTEETSADAKARKCPTALGESLGLSVVTRHSMRGDYDVVVYDQNAQQFVLDNLDSLTASLSEDKESAEDA